MAPQASLKTFVGVGGFGVVFLLWTYLGRLTWTSS